MFVSSALKENFLPEAGEAGRGTVLVVCEQQDDAERISELLENLGLPVESIGDVTSIAQHGERWRDDGTKFVGAVLCKRGISDAEDRRLSLAQLPGRRHIVLSDCDAEHTVVSVLESGAHYYFNINEHAPVLQARLEAAFRFHHGQQERFASFADIKFDLQKRRVTRADAPIDLSPKEYELAYYLFCNRDRVVGNSELMTSIWSLPPSMDTRRIDTAACRLRKKLQLKSHSGWELKRLRSVGYKLVARQRQPAAKETASRLSIVV